MLSYHCESESPILWDYFTVNGILYLDALLNADAIVSDDSESLISMRCAPKENVATDRRCSNYLEPVIKFAGIFVQESDAQMGQRKVARQGKRLLQPCAVDWLR